MLRAHELRKVYATGLAAVKGASFEVGEGEVFGLLGPNGAGKTTLLRMLGTIISPTSGACYIGGVDAATAPDSIRRDIGFLSGNTRLYARLTGRETLRYFGRLFQMDDARIAARIEELVTLLEMQAFIDRRCDTLSTGQTQRVSIARVILHDPRVLILDEPTLGLDIMTSRSIIEFILGARARGHSIIFSTHYMTEAELLCDRVAFIYQGDILALGTKRELSELSGTTNLHDAFLWFADRHREVSA
jgi:sodium transport system ATP-binding protein